MPFCERNRVLGLPDDSDRDQSLLVFDAREGRDPARMNVKVRSLGCEGLEDALSVAMSLRR
jgi:hypothetical protein